MTPDQLSNALSDLDLKRAELARLCGVERETVSRWLREPNAPGARAVPHYVVTILEQRRQIRRLMGLLGTADMLLGEADLMMDEEFGGA